MRGLHVMLVAVPVAFVVGFGCVSSDEPTVNADGWIALQGTVRDYLTNDPIGGVEVTLLSAGARTVGSDANGYWTMKSIPYEAGEPLQVRFTRQDYASFVGGFLVTNTMMQTCNVTLSKFVNVTGHVYASNAPAVGATVYISYSYNVGMLPYGNLDATNPPVNVSRISAVTLADGSFELVDVAADVQGQLIVPAYDADGDGVAEYDTYVRPGGITVSEYANINTEIEINLEGAGAVIDVVYSNISDHAVATATEALDAIFNLPVHPDRIVTALWFHPGDTVVNGLPAGPRVSVPFSIAWDATGLKITVTPLQEMTGDGTYMLELSQEFAGVPAGTNGLNFGGWSSEFVLPGLPVPTILAPTTLDMDTSGYDYVIDWDSALVYDAALTPDDAGYAIYQGLDLPLEWDPVANAVSYNIYARRPGAAGWVLVDSVDRPITIGGFVEGTADLSTLNPNPDVDGFDVYPASYTTPYGVPVTDNQPFAEGESLEIMVTALDDAGQESDVAGAAAMLTLADNKAPALLRTAGIDLNPATGNDVVYDLAGPDITLVFTEPIEDPSGTLAVASSNTLVAGVTQRLGYGTTPLEGDFCMSVQASVEGMSTGLVNDYTLNARFDVTAGDADQFWLGQTVRVDDPNGVNVAVATVEQIDTVNNYLRVTVVSGGLNACLAGYTVTGDGDVKQPMVRRIISAWGLGATNDRLDTNQTTALAVGDLAVGDAVAVTYRQAATSNSVVLSTTVTGLEVEALAPFATIIVLQNTLADFGALLLLDRDGDKISVTGVQDRAGNALDANADTVQFDGANYIVTGN